MSMWTAIFLIVAMSLIASTIRHGISSKVRPSESTIADLKAEFEAREARLRSRIETLERIVTDSKDDLRREFEKLDLAS